MAAFTDRFIAQREAQRGHFQAVFSPEAIPTVPDPVPAGSCSTPRATTSR